MADFADKFLEESIDNMSSISQRVLSFKYGMERHQRIAALSGMVEEISSLSVVDCESILEMSKKELDLTSANIAAIKTSIKEFKKQQKPKNSTYDNNDNLWDLNEDGSLRRTFSNLKNLFVKEGMSHTFKLNTFSHDIEMVEPPVFDTGMQVPSPIKNEHIVMFRDLFSQKYRLDMRKDIIEDVILALAYDLKYHPVKEYLETLPKWDGVKRLPLLLTEWSGGEKNRYTEFLGRLMLVSAVARIYRPGIKYDFMIILEGPQRIGKSLLVKTLGGHWCQEVSLTDRDEKTIEKMLGVWFCEVAETPFFNLRDMNSVKAFITTDRDSVRLPYMRRSEKFPRQSIFVGTFNPQEIGYFRDPTGNTRFLPITITNPDIKKIADNKDQLFAEAKHLYQNGFNIYIPKEDKEMWAFAIKEQSERVEQDDWEGIIANWLQENENKIAINNNFVPSQDVFIMALGGRADQITSRTSARIASVMRKLGHDYYRMYKNGDHRRGFKINTTDKDKRPF